MKNINELSKTRILLTAILVSLVTGMIVWYFLAEKRERELAVKEPLEQAELAPQDLIQFDNFEALVAEIDASEELIDFLNDNFVLEFRQGYLAQTPEELFQTRRGASHDFAVFSAYVLSRNNYEAMVIRYRFLDKDNVEGSQTVVVFRDVDVPKYIAFTQEGAQIFAHGWSFRDLFQAEEQRLDIEIFEYALFSPGIINLETDDWTEIKN